MEKDYKTLYEEAIKRAETVIKLASDKEAKAAAETIFPELKESDDERIRKTLLEYFGEQCDMSNWNGVYGYEVYAWLEKQGEQNKWKPSKDEMDALYGLAYVTNKMDDRKDVAITKLYQDLKREFFKGASFENMFPSSQVDSDINIEKQGEKKLRVESKEHSYITPNSEFFQWIYDRLVHVHNENPNVDYMLSLKERIEDMQKAVDKVEPKFKVGDWIINNDKRIAIPTQILEIEKYGYVTSRGYTSFDKVKTDYHLWTIQDANDGDVLYHKSPLTGIEYIVMSRGVNDHGIVDSYFRYHSVDGFGISVPSVFSAKSDDIAPATKEQCDLLFSKMKEAGYEWDADKKELKKIEQKSAWGEEDERNLKGIIDEIEANKDDAPDYDLATYDRFLSWLKSLKPHWKPSEEQMQALFEAKLASINNREYFLGLLYEDLKKL